MRRIHGFRVFAIAALCVATNAAPAASSSNLSAAEPDALPVYVGTYTRGLSNGIYLLRLDRATGNVEELGLAAESANPSFLALHPTRPLLYAVVEQPKPGAPRAGSVGAFAVDEATGKLALLNTQPSGGQGPCHLLVDRSGRCVLVANYASGSVACLPILEDGQLGAPHVVQHAGSSIVPKRQEGPHAHQVVIDRANRFVFVPDLGTDKVMIYRLDPATATLAANDPPSLTLPPGTGPRHMALHPSSPWAYVLGELSNKVYLCDFDAQRGSLALRQSVSTLPEDFQGVSTSAEVVVHPNGRFLYTSNRGHDSIAIFQIGDDGTLSPVGHEPTQGKSPRNFAVDPSGQYLMAANQATDNIVVFKIDAVSGKLKPTGRQIKIASPVCLEMPSHTAH